MAALPYKDRATLLDRPSTVVASNVPCSVWPTRNRSSAAGVAYDAMGEAPLSRLAELQVANRMLRVGARDYLIVEAVGHEFLPHVALRLRMMKGTGS